MVLRAMLVAAVVAVIPSPAAAARPHRFKATAYNIRITVRGSYAADATGGTPGSAVERHQRVTLRYGARYSKVFFPARRLPAVYDSEWFGHSQHVASSYTNTGFDEMGGARTDVNCSGPLSTDQPPTLIWRSRRDGFRMEFQPVDNLFFPQDCAEPFSLRADQLDVNLHLSRGDLRPRFFNEGDQLRAPRRSGQDACPTADLMPHSCTQSGDLQASVSFQRVCKGQLVYTRDVGDVFTYRGRCGR